MTFSYLRIVRAVFARTGAASGLAAFIFPLVFASVTGAGAAESPWSLHEALGAPAQLRLSGSIRFRQETLAGQARNGVSADDDLFSIRTTLFGEYDFGAIRLGGEIYDSRAYLGTADGSVSANDVNAFEPIQAYVALDDADTFGAGTRTSAQLGRFVLNLGARRLVAADDYRNTMNAFTGLRLDFNGSNGTTATFISVLPQIRRPEDKASVLDNSIAFDRESFDLTLSGGIVNRPRTLGEAAVEASFFHLDERDAPARPTRDRTLETLGGRIIQVPKAETFDYEAEAFYQFGSISDGLALNAPRLDVSAWFVHLDAGYSWAASWKPRASLEFDYASGDGRGATFTRFDTLFGMRRADLAPAGIYAAIGRTNILTPAFRLEMTPSARLDWFVNYRLMWLASPSDSFSTTGVRDASSASGRFAGHQFEARLRYWIVPGALQAEVDAVVLMKGRFLESAPNAPRTGDTRYFSLNLTAFF